jgi:flagellin-like hook-associated protein FlgL
MSQAGINSDEEMAHMIDVDPAQVLMNLRAQETTYQAALAAAATAIPPSLAAFLQ